MDTCNKQETLPLSSHETTTITSRVRANTPYTNENRDNMQDVNTEHRQTVAVTTDTSVYLNSNTLYDALPIELDGGDLDVINAKFTDTTSIKDGKQTNCCTVASTVVVDTQYMSSNVLPAVVTPAKETKNMNVNVKPPQSKLVDYGMSDSEDSNSDSDESLSDSASTSDNDGNNTTTKPNDPEQSVVRNNTEFRENVSSSDSTSEYESDSSTSFSDIGACGVTLTPSSTDKKRTPDKMKIPRTKGELTLDQLPPIEELKITVPEEECIEVGVVTSIIDQLVIVQSLRGTPACDIDTLFFLNRGNKPLGRVFDVLGPVSEPLYAIRFNSYEQALEAGVKPGTPVYCAPRTPHTSYVFVSELMNKRIERMAEKSVESCCDNMEHLNLNNN